MIRHLLDLQPKAFAAHILRDAPRDFVCSIAAEILEDPPRSFIQVLSKEVMKSVNKSHLDEVMNDLVNLAGCQPQRTMTILNTLQDLVVDLHPEWVSEVSRICSQVERNLYNYTDHGAVVRFYFRHFIAEFGDLSGEKQIIQRGWRKDIPCPANNTTSSSGSSSYRGRSSNKSSSSKQDKKHSRSRSPLKCHYCKAPGHVKSKCRKLKKNEGVEQQKL